MSVTKTAGRADLAAAYKALAATPNNFMIGFGAGENWWGSQQQVLLDLDEDDETTINPAHAPVTGVVVRSANAATLYQVGVDYLVDTATGEIDRVDAGSIPAEATLQVTYVPTVPQPDLTTQTLVNEVGRVPVTATHFIVPFDEADDLEANYVIIEGAKYALMSEPARMLLFQGHLNAADGVGAPIREYALFSRCAVDPELPPGQVYFDAADIVAPGVMVIAKQRTPVPHDGTVGLDMSIIFEL
jgi:hypothetical protein